MYSDNGKLILDETYSNQSKIEYHLDVAKGTYFIVVNLNGDIGVHKLVIGE